MMKRTLLLYILFLKATVNRIRDNLAREIVVGICATVIFSLFFYVFNDFLNVEVKNLSKNMQKTFGKWLGIVLAPTVAYYVGKIIKKERRDANSIFNSAIYLGERQSVVFKYEALRAITILGFFYSLYFYLNHNYMWQTHWTLHGMTCLAMLAVTGLSFYISYEKDKKRQEAIVTPLLGEKTLSPMKTLFLWRIKQVLWRNRLTQFCIMISFLFLLLTIYSDLQQAPRFVSILSSFCGGFMIAVGISFQIADDLEYSWAEKNLGVSHKDYVEAIMKTAISLGAVGATLCFLSLLGIGLISDLETTAMADDLKIAIMYLLPTYFIASLAFQIDGRKPIIQIILSLLIGLFICTAVFAHWLGIILVPLFIYYANQTQQNHFYRA